VEQFKYQDYRAKRHQTAGLYYCENNLRIDADLETKRKILAECVSVDKEGERFLDFEKIIPIGEVKDWYSQRCGKWGTKWNSIDCYLDETASAAPLEMDFLTAWGPPVPILVALVSKYHCHAELAYYEPGMNYRGFAVADWQDGEALWDDQSWDMTEKDWAELDLLPE
jgi:hypothetical protein